MKYDRKNDRKDLYQPGRTEFVEVDVPETVYLAIDGHGDPNTSQAYAEAVEALYTTAYGVRACFSARTGSTFVVGPLEGLWSGSDPTSFVAGDKSDWDWTMLIALPEPVTVDDVERGQAAATRKKPRLPIAAIHRLVITEGLCLQIMHVGSYDEEAPTLARLHHEVMPSRGLTWNGRHHEIYLGDPRRTAPQELRTVLRQPVQPVVPLPHPASAG